MIGFQPENIFLKIHALYAPIPIYVYIRGCLSQDFKSCLITAVDITQLKLKEDELLKRINDLEYFHKVVISRELRIFELKEEINQLLKEAGKDKRYLI